MIRRGLGSPFRKIERSQDDVARVVQGQFRRYRTAFDREDPKGPFQPLPSHRQEMLAKFLDAKIEKARAEGNSAAVLGYETYKAQMAAQSLEGAAEDDFRKNFIAWLMGQGLEEDHKLTPWGREPQALELPDVQMLLEDFVDALSLVENYILKLIYRAPQTLGEYAIYYKYVLHCDKWLNMDDPWMFLDFPQLIEGGERVLIDQPGQYETVTVSAARPVLDTYIVPPQERNARLKKIFQCLAKLKGKVPGDLIANSQNQFLQSLKNEKLNTDDALSEAETEVQELVDLSEQLSEAGVDIATLDQNVAAQREREEEELRRREEEERRRREEEERLRLKEERRRRKEERLRQQEEDRLRREEENRLRREEKRRRREEKLESQVRPPKPEVPTWPRPPMPTKPEATEPAPEPEPSPPQLTLPPPPEPSAPSEPPPPPEALPEPERVPVTPELEHFTRPPVVPEVEMAEVESFSHEKLETVNEQYDQAIQAMQMHIAADEAAAAQYTTNIEGIMAAAAINEALAAQREKIRLQKEKLEAFRQQQEAIAAELYERAQTLRVLEAPAEEVAQEFAQEFEGQPTSEEQMTEKELEDLYKRMEAMRDKPLLTHGKEEKPGKDRPSKVPAREKSPGRKPEKQPPQREKSPVRPSAPSTDKPPSGKPQKPTPSVEKQEEKEWRERENRPKSDWDDYSGELEPKAKALVEPLLAQFEGANAEKREDLKKRATIRIMQLEKELRRVDVENKKVLKTFGDQERWVDVQEKNRWKLEGYKADVDRLVGGGRMAPVNRELVVLREKYPNTPIGALRIVALGKHAAKLAYFNKLRRQEIY